VQEVALQRGEANGQPCLMRELGKSMILDYELAPCAARPDLLEKIVKRAGELGLFVRLSCALACILGVNPALLCSEVVSVRHREGAGHGFLNFKSAEGKTLAVGEQIEMVQGDRVKTRLRFLFRDGSIYEETTLFSQSQTFRLISDHILQKGPAFKYSMETTIDAVAGQVIVRSTDEKGKKM
jgi:hypothetical protein